jgi:hypothetical protein
VQLIERNKKEKVVMVRFEVAKVIHEQRVREAVEKQRPRQVDLVTPFYRKRLLLRLGAHLFDFANRLSAFRGRQAPAQLTVYGLKFKRMEGEGA